MLKHIENTTSSIATTLEEMGPPPNRDATHFEGYVNTRQETVKRSKEVCCESVHKHSFARNPLQAGMACFLMMHDRHNWGVVFADNYRRILRTMHIYNAALQEGALAEQWPDLDFLISVHGPEYLYVGQFPKAYDLYLRRYRSAIGASRIGGQTADPDKRRGFYLHANKTLHALANLQSAPAEERRGRLTDLALVLAVTKRYGSGTKHLLMDEEARINAGQLRKLKLPELEPIFFLEDLMKTIDQLLPEFLFDYVSLTCRCYEIENRFADIMRQKVAQISLQASHFNVDVESIYFSRVFQDLEQYDLHRTILPRTKNELLHKTSVTEAAKVIPSYIEEHGEEGLKYLRAKIPGFMLSPVDFKR